MEHKESLPFYHTAAWKKIRRTALSRDGGYCQDCMDRIRAGYGGKPRRAEMVHHIIPVKERPDLALELDNLRSLCSACHAAHHPEKGQREKPEEDGYRSGTRMRIVKV